MWGIITEGDLYSSLIDGNEGVRLLSSANFITTTSNWKSIFKDTSAKVFPYQLSYHSISLAGTHEIMYMNIICV